MYSGIKDPSRYVLVDALAELAADRPDDVWITTTDGETLRFGEAADDMQRVAGYFAGLGVRPGDFVAVMMPSGCDFVRVWLGLGRLGAVAVLLNTELRGAFLAHQIRSSGVRLMVVDAQWLPELASLRAQLAEPPKLVVTGTASEAAGDDVVATPWPSWRSAAPWQGRGPAASDIAAVMYTSGTSGPSKGVLMPHAHCMLYAIGTIKCLHLAADDIYYISLPLFHANGLLMQLGSTLLAGIPAVIRPRFSASAWLSDIRAHRATVTNLLGSMTAFLLAQPEAADDRDHRLRASLNAPNLPAHDAAFRGRFGIRDVASGFGMTECNIPIWGRIGEPAPGAAGWVHDDDFEVVVADPETDTPVPFGELGEILVRPKVPFGFMAGYHGLPEKTVEAWRNLWFHTGDAGLMRADGQVTFVDRIKDCIRRRGENISATEVESVVAGLEGVAEVAAFAVPASIDGGEDEVMLAIVFEPGSAAGVESVAAQVDALLPRFARPRYLKAVDELPKTSTGKVQRAVLKSQGTAGAFDRGDR